MTSIKRYILTCSIDLNPDFHKQQKLRDLMLREMNPDHLINISVKEGMAGLVYKNLEKSKCLDYFSNAQRKKIQSLYHQTALFNLKLIYDLKKVLIRLNEKNIRVVLLQGIVLLQHVYKDVGLRPMTDIDLWVLKKDYISLVNILVSLDFKKDAVYPNTFRKGSTFFDIHTHIMGADRISARRWLITKSQGHIYHDTLVMNVEGQEARCLSKPDQIIYLSLHALKHNVSRLIWLADIKNLVTDWKSSDWEALVERSKELGQEKGVLYIFFLLKELPGFSLPEEVSRLMEEKRFHILEKWVLKQKAKKGYLPDWAPLLLYSPKKGFWKRISMIIETLFPRPEILRQVFVDYPDLKFWQLYLKRVFQLFGMVNMKFK